MRLPSRSRRAFLATLGGTIGLLAAPRIARGRASEPLSFGLTPVFLSSDLELLERLSAYLSDATGSPVRLVTRRTYQEITALVVSGQVDAAWICGYPYVQYRDALSLVAVPLWQGKPLYRSYIIVGRDRAGDDWEVTKGDIHAFSDPDSNSGYLTTTALLAEDSLRSDGFFSSTFFTYGHRNVVRAVASGLAQSGSVDGYVWEVMQEIEPALTDRTRVLRKSEWLGFPPVACASHAASSPRTKALGAALLDMHRDPEGKQVLELLRLDGFAPAQPEMFDRIAAKVSLLGRMG
ncbi:PhnD/SsuA/transferrin family substrate-binding protein [Aurantimonas sp. C2-6-R+9]|nr:PhnD/SsuA/transferrin family substrate-binding protein [Aurantimonas sp. C2-6-R+9]